MSFLELTLSSLLRPLLGCPSRFCCSLPQIFGIPPSCLRLLGDLLVGSIQLEGLLLLGQALVVLRNNLTLLVTQLGLILIFKLGDLLVGLQFVHGDFCLSFSLVRFCLRKLA